MRTKKGFKTKYIVMKRLMIKFDMINKQHDKRKVNKNKNKD
jgi:hypothetical protein